MRNIKNPLPAYQSRRLDLAADLANAKSEIVKEKLIKALLVSDYTIASTYNLAIVLPALANKTKENVNEQISRGADAAHSIAMQIEKSAKSQSSAFMEFVSIMTNLGRLQANTSQRAINMAFLQWDLLVAIAGSWLELLDTLYSSADRKILIERIGKLAEFAILKIPVIGDILDGIKLAFDIVDMKARTSKNVDDYFSSLESYTDVANLCLVGIMSFCVQVERMVKDAELPTDSEIQEQILMLITNVQNKTHPIFIAEAKTDH